MASFMNKMKASAPTMKMKSPFSKTKKEEDMPDGIIMGDDGLPAEEKGEVELDEDGNPKTKEGEEGAEGEGEGEGEGAGDANANAKPKKLTRFERARAMVPNFFGSKEAGDDDIRDPMDRNRWWELVLSIRGFENVTVETLTIFWTVSLGSENPKKHRNRVRLQTKFSSIYTLTKGQVYDADRPINLYERKIFNLSYKELEKHVVKVDMWRVSNFTFNEYYGTKKQKLSLIANRDPNMELRILRKLSRKDAADKKKSKNVADVALFRCRVNLEEIFDFDLLCENWTLEMNKGHPEFNKNMRERKRLTFTMPRDRRTLPGQRRLLGPGAASLTVEWNKEPGRFFWASCGKFVFRGTRTHLLNSYFIVTILTGNPPAFLATNATVAKFEKHAPAQPHRVLGRCLMNLTSVLDMSVFQGKVKKFTTDIDQYIVGDLNGNVKCILRSKGMKEPELDFRTARPEQLKSATTVSHLNKFERYLVVRVKKCESLPVADFDTGTADPYLRCTWDGMTMLSPIIQQTLRPVFNQSFYFPVRVVFPELRMGSKGERKYQDSVLKFELESKGQIKLEVWDDDVTSADCLGACNVGLGGLLNVRGSEKRNLLGPLKAAKEDEEEQNEIDAPPPKTNQWYEEPLQVRVYDGNKTTLGQTALANKDAALIHFECYFYPDWHESLRWDDGGHRGDEQSVWEKKEEDWNEINRTHAEKYGVPFPDSIGGKKHKVEHSLETADAVRRFPCVGLHPVTRSATPLMAFVCPIIVPEEWSFPAKMLEWVHCLSFEITQRQTRTGLIPVDGWKDPEYVLARRKGAPQDHAMLLCSLLLGCKRDAYVVKGSIYSQAAFQNTPTLMEHTWVMTRHEGWVTFWEPSSRQTFHLPNRYDPRKVKKKRAKNQKEEEEKEEDHEDDEADLAVAHWEGEVEDARVRLEDMESLPTVGRMPKPKSRVGAKKKEEKAGREQLKQELLQQREGLEIAPQRQMLQENTLVTWLPYDSIEVVFNGSNVWANRQNHHPASITFDFPYGDDEEDATSGWERFVKNEEELSWQPICPSVSVQPELKPSVIDDLQDDLRTEMMQNLQLYRGKRGMDTMFDHNEELMLQIRIFLEINETYRQIDPDSAGANRVLEAYPEIPVDQKASELSETQKFHRFVCEILGLRTWNQHGSPFHQGPDYKMYQKEQEKLWETLFKQFKEFRKKDDSFPIKRGKKFHGFPVHFCTSDQENIRQYLMQIQEYQEIMDMEEEDVFYTIECKIVGRLGGILSVWLYVGIQEPQREHDIIED